MTRREKLWLAGAVVLSLVIILACFLTPYLFQRKATPGEKVAEGASAVLKESSTFNEALRIVEDYYVDEVSREKLLAAANRGIKRLQKEGADEETLVHRGIVTMIDELDDPFSSFMSSKELEMLDTQLTGRFSGIGVAMTMARNEIRVERVIGGTPAAEAGIKEGDVVKEVDGRDVTGMELTDVVMMIRGEPGTKVTLGISRGNSPTLFRFEIVRREIEIEVIKSEMLTPEIAYIILSDWTENVDEKLRDSLRELRLKGARGLIMDLRSNTGGYMDPAIRSADLFLQDGIIVTSQGRTPGTTGEYRAKAGTEWDFPVVILINRGTASSSEIFSAALHDNSRAVLVGETTFGKGSIQKLFRQEDGTAIKLTVGRYYTPKGKSIDDEGIPPDMQVSNPLLNGEDLQLKEAERVLGALIKRGSVLGLCQTLKVEIRSSIFN
jgi:carboxyl-terminal processing protease